MPPQLWQELVTLSQPSPSFVCSMMSSMTQIPTLLSSTLLLAVSKVPTWGISPSIKGIAASPNCSSTAPKQLCTWSSKSSSNSFSPCNPEKQSLHLPCFASFFVPSLIHTIKGTKGKRDTRSSLLKSHKLNATVLMLCNTTAHFQLDI